MAAQLLMWLAGSTRGLEVAVDAMHMHVHGGSSNFIRVFFFCGILIYCKKSFVRAGCSVQHKLVVALVLYLTPLLTFLLGALRGQCRHIPLLMMPSWWSLGMGVVHVEHIHVLGD